MANIVFSSPYADSNLEVDGSQAALGGSCPSYSCGFLVNGCINTLNNVGGQLQTNIFGACLNVENTYYDRRYNTRANFAPPWFPGTDPQPEWQSNRVGDGAQSTENLMVIDLGPVTAE